MNIKYLFFSVLFLASCQKTEVAPIPLIFTSEIDENTVFIASYVVLTNGKETNKVVLPFHCILHPDSMEENSKTPNNHLFFETGDLCNKVKAHNSDIRVTDDCQQSAHPLLPLRNIAWKDLEYELNPETKKLVRLFITLEISPKKISEMNKEEIKIIDFLVSRVQEQKLKYGSKAAWYDPRDIYEWDGYNGTPRNRTIFADIVFSINEEGLAILEEPVKLIRPPYIESPAFDDEADAFRYFNLPYLSGENIFIHQNL